jgi:hypothetical protein
VSFVGDTIGSGLGGITGTKQAAKGAQNAANTQAAAAQNAIAEQQAARLSNEQRQQPFVNAGTSALAQQMSLIGLNGAAGQQGAIDALLASPEYSTAVRQSEQAILANASATGGLRGGNVQNSLATNRQDLFSNLLSQQMSRLGGLTSLGQNAAAGVGNAGIAVAGQIGDLLQQQGAAIAGGQIAKGNQVANNFNTMAQLAGTIVGFTSGRPKPATSPTITGF